jgi:iron complex transport system permease protein
MRLKPSQIIALIMGLCIFISFPFWGGETLALSSLWNSFGNAEVDHRILWSLRIPRLLLVIGVGGSLAVLGGTYQIIFHNVLAEPYILGVSSAVTFGIVFAETVLHLPLHSWSTMGIGFLFSALVTALLILSYRFRTGREVERTLLFGLGLNFLFSSLLFLMLSYKTQSSGGGSLRWLFGNIPWVSMNQALIVFLATLALSAILWVLGRYLDALSLGDTVAQSLGVSPSKFRTLILLMTSFHLTILTSMTGSIGFLGLVVPHCVRAVFRPASTRQLFLGSFFVGAIFLGVSDGISRALLPPMEFPIGIITTLIGGPLFLYLLWKR